MVAVTETLSVPIERAPGFKDLPPHYRAVLVLREILQWQPDDVAELLGTNVSSVNRVLQRAHAALDANEKGRQS